MLSNRLARCPARSVWFAGHSLGAALAALAATATATARWVCTLGGPLGDVHWAHTRPFGARSLRYVNDADVVTHLPRQCPTSTPVRAIHRSKGHVSNVQPMLHHYFACWWANRPIKEISWADQGHLHRPPTSCWITCRVLPVALERLRALRD